MTTPRRQRMTAWAGVAALGLSANLAAQTPDPRYPTMDAGALWKHTDQSRQVQQDQRTLSKLIPLASPLVLSERQTLTVKGFQFAGAKLLPPESLQAAVAQFANRSLTQADLENIVSAVVGAYRQAGWVVRVYVPAQPLSTDVLTVQVLESIPPPLPR